MTMTSLQLIQKKIWLGHIPLQIELSPSESRSYNKTDPYLVSIPRLSYLPLLLPRLHAFFLLYLINPTTTHNNGWFSYESVPLKWHVPIGLLYDLYASPSSPSSPSPSTATTHDPRNRQLPFRLVCHFSDYPSDQLVLQDEELKALHDAFINSVKEADFVRNGTAKGIMSLSKENSTGLWDAVRQHDLSAFTRINTTLLPPPNQHFRNIPLRIYVPSSPSPPTTSDPTPPANPPVPTSPDLPQPPSDQTTPSLKIIQSPIPPLIPSSSQRSRPQTLGTALHTLLPGLFPSRSRPVLAVPVLHGAQIPMGAVLEEVARGAGYVDGWVCVVVRMV